MIYSCQNCGAWFTSDEINKASKNRDAVITCSFCGFNNEFLNPNASRLTRGYNALEEGRFGDAINVLTMEIEESERKRMTPSPDAFLGLALARFGVRTIFDSTDAKRMGTPLLSCWEYNDMYFADDDNLIKALRSFDKQSASSGADNDRNSVQAQDNYREKAKINEIKERIDTIKDYYEEIRDSKKKNPDYGVFIAFEDQDEKAATWETLATKVRNTLPKLPRSVFTPPDRSNCVDDLQYEARMLYALHHSKCMLVLIGDNPSTRLRDMYTWYYHNGHKYQGISGNPGKNLGFVFHNIHIPIRVSNGNVDRENLFETNNPQMYKHFVARWNNIILDDHPGVIFEPKKEEDKVEIKGTKTSQPENVYTILDEHHLAFGHYPQSLEKSLAVTQHFNQYERPDKTDDHGWIVLFRNHGGEAYTWYRDELVDGKKYRAVYFTRFREKCSVRESKEKSLLQKDHGYVLKKIYCFSFDPLVWDVEKIQNNSSVAILISDRGIDSREYNNIAMDNAWECCSIHSWLNSEFYENAFEDTEKKILCQFENDSDDKVFLMDKEEDRIFVDRHNSIAGSDYYKCLGGMGDRCISNCWITDKSLDHNGEAAVIYPTTRYSLDKVKVDNTSVAVLPKIIITLKDGDEKRLAK